MLGVPKFFPGLPNAGVLPNAGAAPKPPGEFEPNTGGPPKPPGEL